MFIKWNQKVVLLIAALLLMSSAAFATQKSQDQDNVWSQLDRSTLAQPGIDAVMPTTFGTFRLNKAALEALLARAPEEYSGGQAVILSLPMPDGSVSRFEIEHSLVVERGLLKNYPRARSNLPRPRHRRSDGVCPFRFSAKRFPLNDTLDRRNGHR